MPVFIATATAANVVARSVASSVATAVASSAVHAPVAVWRRRRHIGSRVVAAVLGGYATAALLATMLVTILHYGLAVSRPAAVAGATLVAAPAYVAAVLWVCAASSPARAWLGLALPCLAMAIVLWGLACFGVAPA